MTPTATESSWKLRARRLYGGINPAACKSSSLRSRIMPVPLPDSLILPLAQGRGSAARPCVKVGDQVLKYQLLAEAVDEDAVALHAPTSGTISAIEPRQVPAQGAQSGLCIVLRCDGEDQALMPQPLGDWRPHGHREILERLENAGIAGLGGAGFSLTRKLRRARERRVELLIVNGAECEPYISADEALIREHAAAVVNGAGILQAASLARRCVIAIEKDKRDAIAALRAALTDSDVELILLGARYPSGGEKQLVQMITGQEVPSGKHPPDIGILVQNAGTAFAAHRAISEGIPCISRIITVTGAPLQTPKNFDALIGTPVSFLLQLCGLDQARHNGTIVGGSLMGIHLACTDVPVIKTSNCLIATCAEEFPKLPAEQACIRCGFCAEACPAHLLPQQLYVAARSRRLDLLQDHGLADCIECGACAYVCPSHIPLVQYYRAAKELDGDWREQQARGAHWRQRFQFNRYRHKLREDGGTDTEAGLAAQKSPAFDRDRARQDIADAVARVKARRKNVIASDERD